ncbi:MAG: hypothetical protein GY864_13445, partial [Desulfobacterales bacterium]|nr:hypothetical protein [Desulfobacterales bacterium]
MQKQLGSNFFIIFLICSLILLLKLFWTYLSAIVLAFLIVSVFYPVYYWIKRIVRGSEIIASLSMILIILLVLILPISWFVGILSNEAFDFYKNTRSAVSMQKIQEVLESDSLWAQRIRKVGDLTGVEVTTETVQSLAAAIGKRVGLFLYNQIRSMASNLLSFLVHFFLMMLVIY